MINCPTLIKLQFSEKSDVIEIKCLCFGWLKPGHMKKLCQNKVTCEHCSDQHPTVMHTLDRQNSQLPRSEQTKVHVKENEARADNKRNKFAEGVCSFVGSREGQWQ